MLGLNLTVKNDDLIDVMGDIYAKTPEALNRLLKELRKSGYEVEDLRQSDYRKKDGVPVATMEINGWSLWFAKLPNLRFGICGTCHQQISTTGIQSHGHKCEKCGAVTYYELVDGSTFTFVFNNDEERGMFAPELRMKVKEWDTENGILYLYPEFLKGGLSVVTGEKAEAYLKRNEGKWSYGSVGQGKLIAIKYDLNWNRNTAVIEPYDHYGSYWNHKIVKVWKGKQYAEYDRLPIPETISIYESWHWAPLPVSTTLHRRILSAARQTDDKGWHYQDGRPWFTSGHWTEMAKFIRHFTKLDADAFDRAWPSFRRDGPGGIDDFAHFCHKEAVTRDEPNVGNVLVALGKQLDGEHVTKQESEAAIRGLDDPMTRNFLKGLQRR
ncbi:MAG: hypothetical protein HYV90_02270 [Candidatus Woesebacteria bacterium]|nr:MAG: hypothetical protein HYV90_02270 [Candidatus Woesebacteria bacterium]